MNRIELYRLRATEAEERAAQARDLEAKRIYLEIARRWREAAEAEQPSTASGPALVQPQQQRQPQKKLAG